MNRFFNSYEMALIPQGFVLTVQFVIYSSIIVL